MDFLKRRPFWTALGGLVCFLVAFALVWGFAGRFRSGENRQVAGDILRVAAPEAAQPREGETAPPSLPPEATPDWIVYVTGEVRHPGIVRVPPESRVYEAEGWRYPEERRNLIFHKAAYRDHSGRVAGLVCVMVDITPLKDIQAELTAAKEKAAKDKAAKEKKATEKAAEKPAK